MVNYQGKKIVIFGLGQTGISCVYYFLKQGIIPHVIDSRVNPPELKKLPKQVEHSLGYWNDHLLMNSDLIVVSPGVSLMHPSLKTAFNAGIEIIGDVEIFCREIKAPMICITGSNGKSTVTTLLGNMAKAAGIRVGIGGNIGLPVLMLLNYSYDLYILELSSFQLETTNSLQASVATILNITEDHMDRYPLGLNQYRAAKLRIYKNAKTCLVNIDDNLTNPIFKNKNNCVTFGIKNGDYCLNQNQNGIWFSMKGKNILNVKEIKLYGKHNYINILAALALSDIIELPISSSLKELINFTGLEHRFQVILERNGIRWINDSKSTNIGSIQSVLNSLEIDGTLHLILGGDSKSANFLALKSYFIKKKIKLYCFGQDGRKIATLFPEISEQTETMEQAIYLLIPRLHSGDTVLLSPGCASFDQFKNFEQRGNIFTYLARKLG